MTVSSRAAQPRGISFGTRGLATLGMALALSGCGLFQSKAEALRESVVETALDQVGEDYEYGGADPDDGFDCSGLVWYSYMEAGLKLPRSAAAQKKGGRPIKFGQARRFGERKAAYLHVVMYIGDGAAVHAPVRDGEVEVIEVTARHWRDRYVGAVRYIRED
jgi:cell wall-associated NlpC family hydrolase